MRKRTSKSSSGTLLRSQVRIGAPLLMRRIRCLTVSNSAGVTRSSLFIKIRSANAICSLKVTVKGDTNSKGASKNSQQTQLSHPINAQQQVEMLCRAAAKMRTVTRSPLHGVSSHPDAAAGALCPPRSRLRRGGSLRKRSAH